MQRRLATPAMTLLLLAGCAGDVDSGGATADVPANLQAPGSSSDAGQATDGAAAPSFGSIPWQTGAAVGNGVATKDTGNPLGSNIFIGYAGYGVTLAAAEAWVGALYQASLRDRGVRRVYAVQGPADPGYDALEIGNSKIAAALASEVGPATRFVLVVAHSSGGFVASELLGQLATGADPTGVIGGNLVYIDLDGGQKYVTSAGIARLRNAYYVGARDVDTGTLSPNHSVMESLGSTYASKGGFLEYDGSTGCDAGGTWCVHDSLINTRPHDPDHLDVNPDYSDFAGRPVNHFWIDSTATAAGLQP
jgi:hypothetical protein